MKEVGVDPSYEVLTTAGEGRNREVVPSPIL